MSTIGVDEVGRGCWAGPLVAAAVILDKDIKGLNDSKLLSRVRCNKLDLIIRQQSGGYGIGWVSPAEVDRLGLTAAVRRAMEMAIGAVLKNLSVVDKIIIDGNYNYLKDFVPVRDMNVITLVKADSLVPAVSAASIIAKVARDSYMCEQARLYPAYGFDKHVGYGTKRHIAALRQFGVTPLHRLSYKPIKALLP